MSIENIYFKENSNNACWESDGKNIVVENLQLNDETKHFLNIPADDESLYSVTIYDNFNIEFVHNNVKYTLPPPIIILNGKEFIIGKDIELCGLIEPIQEPDAYIYSAKISENLFNEIKINLTEQQILEIEENTNDLRYKIFINSAPYNEELPHNKDIMILEIMEPTIPVTIIGCYANGVE